MRITTLPILLLLILGVAQHPSGATKVTLGQEFNIKNGGQVIVNGENLRITFSSVSADSRCPTGAQCVWAGNAAIAVEIAKKKKKQTVVTLNTSSEPKEVAYKRYKIRLVALSPHPKVNETIDQKEYEATFLITKGE
jgi:hypothetical protein